MKICYFDAFPGISGDMAVGALVDASAHLQTPDRRIASAPRRRGGTQLFIGLHFIEVGVFADGLVHAADCVPLLQF